jgi:hypothetical protein
VSRRRPSRVTIGAFAETEARRIAALEGAKLQNQLRKKQKSEGLSVAIVLGFAQQIIEQTTVLLPGKVKERPMSDYLMAVVVGNRVKIVPTATH